MQDFKAFEKKQKKNDIDRRHFKQVGTLGSGAFANVYEVYDKNFNVWAFKLIVNKDKEFRMVSEEFIYECGI